MRCSLAGAGGRAVAAESLLLHQLLISNRSLHGSRNLTTVDRLVPELITLVVSPRRIAKLCALAKQYRPGDSGSHGPSWQTFIAPAKDSLWGVDHFRCESILLRSHWMPVVMDVFTHCIIGFGVERADVDGISVCRMFNRAIAGKPLPKRLSMGRDPLFRFHRWRADLRVLEIEEIKSAP